MAKSDTSAFGSDTSAPVEAKKTRTRKLDADGNPVQRPLLIVFTVDTTAADPRNALNVIGVTRNGSDALELMDKNPGAIYKRVVA